MDQLEPFASLGAALAVGLLIGLEREQSAPEADAEATFLGGVRTYPLVALGAAVGALLVPLFGIWILLGVLAAQVAFQVVAFADDVRRGAGRGLTTEAAFLLTFLLGALAGSRGLIEPVSRKVVVVLSVGVVATLLLSAKAPLHAFVGKATRADVFATLKFLIVAVVVLPLLPDATYGPLDVLNPHEIGLMIVLIAGIGFVGYVAIRILGSGRGLGVTGLLGGLVSSTAVTLSMSSRARTDRALAPICAMAVILASTVMFGRIAAEVAVVNRALLPGLLVPLGAMAGAGALAAGLLFRGAQRAQSGAAEVTFANPFELSSAVKFGLLYAAILFASKAATVYFGASVVYLAGALAGATDVDAITLSMASLAGQGELEPRVAITTILIGAGTNTCVKGGLATVLGGWAFGRMLIFPLAGVLLAGGLALVLGRL